MALDSMEKEVILYLLDLVEVDLVAGAAKHSVTYPARRSGPAARETLIRAKYFKQRTRLLEEANHRGGDSSPPSVYDGNSTMAAPGDICDG